MKPIPTHICLVLECEPTPGTQAMEVGCTMAVERARLGAAVFRRPEPLESLGHDGGVFTVVVSVHLDVRCTDVYFVTTILC